MKFSLPIWLSLCAFSFLDGVYGVPQVKLGQSTINGLSLPMMKQEFFGGIPYAQPPVGDLRFRPPQVLKSLGVPELNASDFGPTCPQVGSTFMSEDCLTVNIWRPAGLPNAVRLPVMFWVYGGGFLAGNSSVYNASGLVVRSLIRGTPIIYVSFNYRVGPLGFPQGREAQKDGALNLGLKDQLAALQWVQDNIETFGGDKDKVTLFGESAGAISLAMLFLNSDIQKFARAAIFESGSQSSNRVFPPDRDAPFFKTFADAVPECKGATTNAVFSCLRQANLSTIISAQALAIESTTEPFPFGPVIDGPGGVIPDVPSILLAQGKFTKLPFMTGTNKDEGTSFIPRSLNTTEQMVGMLTNFNLPEYEGGPLRLTTAIDTFLSFYPEDPVHGSPFNTGRETFGLSPTFKRAAAVLGDLFFLSTRRQWQTAAALHGVKTFGYHFTDSQGHRPIGVFHGAELFYLYGALKPTASPEAHVLSDQISDYWISFATTLDPNDGKGHARAIWPPFTSWNQVLLQLDSQNLVVIPDNFRQESTSFLNSVPFLFYH